MKRLLVICGPTATGKTALGIRFAKKFDGEVVSADSRQVYRGMGIVTGKELPANSKFLAKPDLAPRDKNQKHQLGYYLLNGIPVWLYDVVGPDYRFTVADYVTSAKAVIKDIWRRKKLPILVGGTGFYIKGLVDGIGTMGIGPDWELREKLSNLAIEQLRGELRKLDPQKLAAMNESDQNNPRRLIRAIEIALHLWGHPRGGVAPAAHPGGGLGAKIDVLFIGLTAPYKMLYWRIDQRVGQRLEMGAEEEIKKLLAEGYNFENSALGTTIGYKEWKPYFQNPKSKTQNPKLHDEIIQRWKYDEHGYARRQMTWFRKDKRIHWFDIGGPDYRSRIEKLVYRWYNQIKLYKPQAKYTKNDGTAKG